MLEEANDFMRSARIAILLTMLFPVVCHAQTRDRESTAEAAERARQLLAKIQIALGGEIKLQNLRSLSLSGKYHRRGRAGQTIGEIKIDILAPDKFLRIEESNPQPALFVTIMQAVNGHQIWFDRKTNRAAGDDGSSEIAREQPGRTSPIAGETTGMRGTTTGRTTVRTNPPGTNTTERTVLGMPLPAPQGRDLNSEIDKIGRDRKASAQIPVRGNRPPGIENPDVRSTLEKQIRKEFACLVFALTLTSPSSFPLESSYAGEIETEKGKVEAIEISGPEEFAARLFIDQASHRPVMISYRELISQKSGYVVSADENNRDPENKNETGDEIAIQLYLADYRNVNGIVLPFQITKAVNGVPVDEWKIEKYKVNPDLKPKKFEKR
jgi:hypothetical protein